MTDAYPRDEFDAVVVPRNGRRGAHRSRPGLLGSLAPQVVAGLVVVAAGVGAVTALGGGLSGGGAGARLPSGGASADAAVTHVVTVSPATGVPSSAAVSPSPSTSSTPAASTSAASTPSTSPSRSTSTSPSSTSALTATPVVVLNTTHSAGLAARTAASLTKAGWTVTSTGNQTAAVRATVVEYADASLSATASALARQVGGTVLHVRALSAGPVVVVLGPDAVQ